MGSWRGGEPTGEEKRSWRKKGNAAPIASSGKYWVTGAGSKPLISGNLVRLFVALAALVATTVGMVVYLLNTNHPTPLISIVTVEYEHPWAPNAWAKEDQQRIKALEESTQFKVAAKQQKEEEGTWQQLIDLELEKTTPGGPGGSLVPALWGYPTIIIHLSAHGVLNAASEPCLLFAEADPLDDRTWVPLSNVLRAIGANEKVKQGDARVLVLLDTGKQPPDIRCGLLCAGFVDAAVEKIQSLPFTNFAVLLSCGEDQCAWTAPELGGSVFGVMVTSGLQGRADALAGNRNGKVTVQELAQFVSSTVDGYVREYRGRVQNPNLVWCGEDQAQDFDLCYQSAYGTSAASTYQPNLRIGKMNEAWTKFEEWSKKSPSHVTWPRTTASSRLARAEQLLWAGPGYETQFSLELDAAFKIISTPVGSRWPTAICGASLAFLNRTHDINADLELKEAGLEFRSLPKPRKAAADRKENNEPSASPLSTTDGQDAAQPSNAADNTLASASTTETTTSEELSPAQHIELWLTYDSQPAADAPPPERPELPHRPLAIDFLTRWLADNPQHLNSRVMARVLEWLGPIADNRSVSREEALLRTINDHLQLTSFWNLPAADRLGRLWSQYIQSAAACEFALAIVDSRGSKTLEREAAVLARDLQLVRDHIHGCETQREASDCANELIALRSETERILDARQRLERGWKLRDELALELPTLAQWIASPIGRLQSMITPVGAWELTGQLSQRLQVLQSQLAAGKIPEPVVLEAIDGELDQLVTAYSRAMYDLFELSAKGQRQPLGNLMLSLGLRPNILRGVTLSDRARLHQGLDDRYRDFVNMLSDESLKKYCESKLTDGVDDDAIWRLTDLPKDLATYPPLLFTETATNRPLGSAQATANSERGKWVALGGEMRQRWSKLPEQLSEVSQASVDAMSSQEETAIREAEEKLMNAELHAHLIAQLLPSDRLSVLPVPTALAQEVCNEQFALWQARRVLTDFWKTPSMPQAQSSMFMSASAGDWLTAIPLPARGPAMLCAQFLRDGIARAESWKDVMREVKAEQSPIDTWQAELSVAKFPVGWAWLRLALGGNATRALPLQNRRFQSPIETGPQVPDPTKFSLLTGELPEGNHELIAWFRGHAANASIPIYQQQPPVILAWQTEEVGNTTIRVNAQSKPARIVFVLDCSNSMGERAMGIAKQTLMDVIRGLSLLNAGQTEIAVVLFGHTSDYGSGSVDSHSTWPGRKNRPFKDVEIIQELATPSEQVLERLQNTLANVQHFGFTPLYLSIIESTDLLLKKNDGFVGDLRVVVITDGEDNIFPFDLAYNAGAKGNVLVPNQYILSAQSAINRASGRVSLDFVAFNLEEKHPTLDLMAAKTGGKVYTAGNNDLAEQLRKSIVRDTFSTKNLKTGRTIGSRVLVSNKQVIPADQLPGNFEVQIDDTTHRKLVTLVGGETIEMQYGQDGLTFLPYDNRDTPGQFGTFTFGGQPYRALMLTGIPDSIPQVRMCLQSQNAMSQSLRPDLFLLELQRTQPGQEGQGERIAWTTDALWENDRRSPVLRVTIKNLPELGRDRLECRLWLPKKPKPEPAELLPIARLKEQPIEVAPGVEVSAATELQTGGLLLTLTEKRQADGPLVHWRVLPAPDKLVEHQVHSSRVEHEYFFSDPTVLNRIEVSATPLPIAPNDDWQATQWIHVPEWRKSR